MKVEYDYNELMSMIDSTLLKPVVTGEELQKLCEDALNYKFKAVVVNPLHVRACKKQLKDTTVKVCTVVGFPLGEELTKVKLYQTKRAVKEGADEIDVVICLSAVKKGDWKYIAGELGKIVRAVKKGRLVKVILETSYLTEEEIVKACQICVEAGARFVKTGTGFAGHATPEHVALMLRSVKAQLAEMSNKNDMKHCEVKAASGIKTYEQARSLAEAGATRIGTSHAAEIAEEGAKSDRVEKREAKEREKEREAHEFDGEQTEEQGVRPEEPAAETIAGKEAEEAAQAADAEKE